MLEGHWEGTPEEMGTSDQLSDRILQKTGQDVQISNLGRNGRGREIQACVNGGGGLLSRMN